MQSHYREDARWEILIRGISKGGTGGAIPPPPLFGRIEGADGSGATPHYYLYCYLPPHFEKLLTPLLMKNI